MAKRKPQLWYHGGQAASIAFGEQRWDRDRTTASVNSEGPGVYLTSSKREALNYGPVMVQVELPSDFKLIPRRKPSMAQLRELYARAPEQSQKDFLADWAGVSRDKALKPYSHQKLLQDAFITLYGDLFRHDAGAYINALMDMGYDGLLVPRESGIRHLVVWNLGKLRGRVEETYYDPGRDENPSRSAPSQRRILR